MRKVIGHIGREADIRPREEFTRVDDGELPVLQLDVRLPCLHQMGRDLLRLGGDLLDRADNGRTADRRRVRPIMPAPKGTLPVSPWTISIWDSSHQIISATTCAKIVSHPCPWECKPVKTEMLPVGFTLTVAAS